MCLPLGMGTINQYSTSGLSQSLLARAHDRGLSPSNNRKGPDRLASVSKFSNHAPTGKVSLLKTLIGLLCSGLFEATKTCTFGALMTQKVLGSRNFQSQRHGRLALSSWPKATWAFRCWNHITGLKDGRGILAGDDAVNVPSGSRVTSGSDLLG